MFKYISIFLLTLLLVGCAGKPKFDIRTQTVAYKDLEVRAQKNPVTGEYNPLLLKDGTEGTYEKVWAEISGDIRDSYLTGDEGQDGYRDNHLRASV